MFSTVHLLELNCYFFFKLSSMIFKKKWRACETVKTETEFYFVQQINKILDSFADFMMFFFSC